MIEAAPVAEWLRPLVFSALNRLLILPLLVLSLAGIMCVTSQVLLVGGQYNTIILVFHLIPYETFTRYIHETCSALIQRLI